MVKKGLLGLGACAFLAALVATNDAQAADTAGWKLTGGNGGEGTGYNLYSVHEKGYLDFKDRWGANLGWTSKAEGNIEIRRKPGTGSGDLKCGELVAIKVEKEWMIYGKQDYGVNLTTRTQLADAHYQWKLCAGKSGSVVPKGESISLTNTVENDAILGCKRPVGVNLVWANDAKVAAGRCVRTSTSR